MGEADGVLPPGQPGIAPTWTSSAKSGVGTAVGLGSRLSFTLSHGIVNEVYYPRLDQANTRDFGLLVTDGHDYFSEEKRATRSEVEMLAPGVPGFRLTNTCLQGRYQVVKTVIADPDRDTLLQRVQFVPLVGLLADYHLYGLLAPHIGNRGYGNSGWTGDYKGVPMLFAERDGTAMALASSTGFVAASCGYVGISDGWQDISLNRRLTRTYSQAPDGNIALTAEIDLQASGGDFVLALGFGANPAEAGQRTRASLAESFEQIQERYIAGWNQVQRQCFLDLDRVAGDGGRLYRTSTSVLHTHRAKRFPGGMIASLSIPWGASKGDDDLGGYHLVWPRDLVESATALLAAGDAVSARQTLVYLMATQDADGHWPQNMWMDGTPYWNGIQMDEAAFPILLADLLRRNDSLDSLDPWPMVRRAACYIVANGPVTQQDRWEEDGGYSPFTLGVEIAALVAAASLAEAAGEPDAARYMLETADAWNDNIERWTYVAGTDLALRLGVRGYYVRIAPVETAEAASPREGFVPIKNRPPGQDRAPCEQIVSPDALALVRFGLRAPGDPRIRDTLAVIDALLKTETATGPVWHRYDGDGYGEHSDGSPFDGTGIGRGWPLFAGERAHYELAAANRAEAERLLTVMERQTSPGGLMPEQVWDAPDIPELELFNGRPAGSAMPLVWAHAEHTKLLRSLRDDAVFDMPAGALKRYVVDGIRSARITWRFNEKCGDIPEGKILRVETLAPSVIHWSADGWRTVADSPTTDSGLGVHWVDLPTQDLHDGDSVVFTFYWPAADRWEGKDYALAVCGEASL